MALCSITMLMIQFQNEKNTNKITKTIQNHSLSIFLMILHSSQCVSENINVGRSYNSKNITALDCFFSRLSQYKGSGGVINVDGGSYSMNVSNSAFYNCTCSSYGGAIFFTSLSSTITMICAHRCSANYYHFAHIRTDQQNRVEYLSMSSCSHLTIGNYPFYLFSGFQSVDNTNCSLNNANQISCVAFATPLSFTSLYCTLANNRVAEYMCIYLYQNSGTLYFANIVQNNSPSYGIVYVFTGSPKIYYCIFANNENNLFNTYSGSPDISHCFISHSGTLSLGTNNTYTVEHTYVLEHYMTNYCYADNPLIVNTPSIPVETPIKSPNSTPQMSLIATILNTPNNSPFESPYKTPLISNLPTHNESPNKTPILSPIETPFMSPIETPFVSQIETPFISLIETPKISTLETPIISQFGTPGISSIETPTISGANSTNSTSFLTISLGITLMGGLSYAIFLLIFQKSIPILSFQHIQNEQDVSNL